MKQSKLARLIYLGLISTTFSHSVSVFADATLPTVYGKFNVSLEQRDLESAGTDQWELNSNASRLGVKGSVDINDSDLKVVYQAEYEINADDGADGSVKATIDPAATAPTDIKSSSVPFSQRNTFVGLQGNFGQVIVGKIDTPLKTSEGKVDQFNDLHADIDVLVGGQNRANNIVQYSSPKLAENIVLNAAFIPAEGADVDSDGKADDGPADSISLSAVYDDKTFYAALAVDQNQATRRSVDGIKQGDVVRLVGGWKTGDLELGGLLQQTTDTASGSENEDTSILVSAAYKVDALKYKIQLAQSQGGVSDDKRTLTALGVDYSLASKTTLYSYLSSLDADLADTTDSVIGVGLSHSF